MHLAVSIEYQSQTTQLQPMVIACWLHYWHRSEIIIKKLTAGNQNYIPRIFVDFSRFRNARYDAILLIYLWIIEWLSYIQQSLTATVNTQLYSQIKHQIVKSFVLNAVV